ncbi:MAG: rubrerythrin family protein [Clostridia bacterium]|nr:rubrerythrin family protein [Clostridia bacterium]
MEFQNSQTYGNLMRAFAGESQARNRYTFAAGIARGQKLITVERVLLLTADQEKEHAELFYKYLAPCNGKTVAIDGTYPVNLSDSVAELLRYAQHNEYEEFDTVYPTFGKIAKEEGFDRIAETFFAIAAIEKTHGDRFARFAEAMETDRLFKSDGKERFMCLNCGHIYEGTEVPEVCPVCYHAKGYFAKESIGLL